MFDLSNDFNAILLTSDNKVATNSNEATKLFMVTKLPSAIKVTEESDTVEYTYSLEKGLAVGRSCNQDNLGDPENNPSCLITFFYMGGTNFRVNIF